jgi:polyphosphate kinase
LARIVLVPKGMERSTPQTRRIGAISFELRPVILEPLSESDASLLARSFREQVLPALTPIALDHAHPLPDLPAGSIGLFVRFRRPSEQRVGVVLVPPLLPQSLTVRYPERSITVRVEHAIARYVSDLFTTLPVEKSWSFRVTRTDEPAQLRFVIRNVA